jgi:aryl-alcohol dehydrogenase-like predicted oxidoreductase
LDYAAQHNKGILIKKALASGHVCLADGIDPVQASFSMIFEDPATASAIVGTINPRHLKSNVECVAKILSAKR